MKKLRVRRKPSHLDQVNVGESDQMTIEGFVPSPARRVLFWALVILSCGALLVAVAWKRSLRVKATHNKCPLDVARTVLLTGESGDEFEEVVFRPSLQAISPADHVHFYHKKIKYIWRPEQGQFSKLKGLDTEKCSSIYRLSDEGLSYQEAELRWLLYSSNSIIIDVKPVWRLVLDEVVSPFYIYQLFIVIVWLAQLYYQFAVCIFLFSVVSVSLQVYETRKQSLLLREKVHSEGEVCLIRNNNLMTKPSKDLVPGDVIILPIGSSYQMECDAVLISGNCTVDESMLTGESCPITKIALAEEPNCLFSNSKHRNNTLFCGTLVLHVQATDDAHVKAVVLRTGYSTAKGELVRSILYPKEVNSKLKHDYVKCMILFFVLGVPCMVYTGRVFSLLSAPLKDTIIIVVDVATFLCPPLLPAVMTSINAHAQRRLRSKGIFCLNASFINFGGGLDVVCFDKTGTLTEDTIDFSRAVPVSNGLFKPTQGKIDPDLTEKYQLFLAMGCCHSLVEYSETINGDSLDIKMFEALNWEFKGSSYDCEHGAFERMPDRLVGPKLKPNLDKNPLADPKNESVYGIVRQFPFESHLQRMTSVAIKSYSKAHVVFVKGAPEKIIPLCDESSVPSDWEKILESYAREGLRVLAAAYKLLEQEVDTKTVSTMPREELETDMVFAGYLVFANQLKEETPPALAELKVVDIRIVMATGDNMLTAVSVARTSGMIEEADAVIQVEAHVRQVPEATRQSECEELVVSYKYAKLPGFSEGMNILNGDSNADDVMVPMVDGRESDTYHLAVDGSSFELIRLYDNLLFERLVHKGTIFARMTPENKLRLVEELQRQDHQVGMCGDGANDCGALRAANAGISLSMAESSVASPFTYKEKNISCFPILIKEGRATLAATFGAFKYQVCYCFVLLGAAMTLFWDGQKPSDGGYVFIDVILNILPPLVFGTTKASAELTKRRPQRSLFAFLPLFSIFSFVFMQVTIYLSAKSYLVEQPWYEPFAFNSTHVHKPEPSHVQLTVLSLNTMSYVISAIIFAPGLPYRQGFFSNRFYMLVVGINFAMVFIVTIYPSPDFFMRFINFKAVPSFDFKLLLFTVSICNFVVSYAWEVLLIQKWIYEKVAPNLKATRGPVHLYEKLEADMETSRDWPPAIGLVPLNDVPKLQTFISVEEEGTFTLKRRQPVWPSEDTATEGEEYEMQSHPRTFFTFGGTPRTSL